MRAGRPARRGGLAGSGRTAGTTRSGRSGGTSRRTRPAGGGRPRRRTRTARSRRRRDPCAHSSGAPAGGRSAAAAPLVAILHERTGNVAAAILVLAALALVTVLCALFFPDRSEELHPGRWAVRAAAE